MLKLRYPTLALLCCVCASGAMAEREWPEHKFECQVVTASGAAGHVAIQTHSRQLAQKNVVGLQAITNRNRAEKAVSVVQCIERAKGENFSDSGFAFWLTTLEE